MILYYNKYIKGKARAEPVGKEVMILFQGTCVRVKVHTIKNSRKRDYMILKGRIFGDTDIDVLVPVGVWKKGWYECYGSVRIDTRIGTNGKEYIDLTIIPYEFFDPDHEWFKGIK